MNSAQQDKKHPRVSIGLPVYNGAPFLAEALDSLLQQTYSDFELVVSDNASIDQTEEICRTYASHDGRIRYYRNQKNIGAIKNFNEVFRLSRGEYFKWASADDRCAGNLIERCVEELDQRPDTVLVCGRTRYFDAQGNSLDLVDPGWNLTSSNAHERLRYTIFAGHYVNCHYGVIRSAALNSTRLLPNYPGGDYCLLAELSLAGKFIELPDYLFYRRLHRSASSQNGSNNDWLIEFFKSESAVRLPRWRRSVDMARTIVSSKLEWRRKRDLIGSLLRAMWWTKRALWRELLQAPAAPFDSVARHAEAQAAKHLTNHGL